MSIQIMEEVPFTTSHITVITTCIVKAATDSTSHSLISNY